MTIGAGNPLGGAGPFDMWRSLSDRGLECGSAIELSWNLLARLKEETWNDSCPGLPRGGFPLPNGW